MATLEARLIALAQALGADIKALRLADGTLASLSTTAKTSLVAAINEVYSMIGASGAAINDTAGDGNITETWSANKIFDEIAAAKSAVINQLLNGAGASLDTLNELAAALGNDPNYATTISTALGLRLRVDAAQVFDAGQQTQGRSNIGAASDASLTALSTAVGDTDRNFTADYTAARDA